MAIFKRKYQFFLFLALIVVISYGQTLWMEVWRDANAIFFKFNHLSEPAGYLGRGLFGEGPYRFSVTPYWFIYKLVGYSVIWPYYLLNLIFYLFATYAVYFLFLKLFSQKAAKVAAFLYAVGYIALEGFISLDSSMILNVSIIFSCLALGSYLKNYFIGLFFFWLALFVTPVRTHYLVFIVILLEIFWKTRKINMQRITFLIVKAMPFLFLFYWFLIKDADKRTFALSGFVKDVLSGQFYKLYSTLGSLGYLFVPDKEIHFLSKLNLLPFELITILVSVFFILKFTHHNHKKIGAATLVLFSFAWIFLSRSVYTSAQITPNIESQIAVFLGGFIILFFLHLIFISTFDTRKKLIFLFAWLLLNLIIYTSYEPTNIYQTYERYVAHSFVPLCCLFALIWEKNKNRVILAIPILWGVMNLFNSVTYEHQVLINRSFPARNFYHQLETYVPTLTKGDVLYFNVSPEANGYFASAFSVGQMPETTAIAWRYGIDRYDIQRFTDYTEFSNYISTNKIASNKIHTFFYSTTGLVNTTDFYRNILLNRSKTSNVQFHPDGGNIVFDEPLNSVTPIQLTLQLTATPEDQDKLTFPVINNFALSTNPVTKDKNLIDLAFQYNEYKNNFTKTVKIQTSSDWTDSTSKNAIDANFATAWRADRILWADGKENLILDIGKTTDINKIVWINAYPNNSPIHYSFEVSIDGKEWQKVNEVNSQRRIDSSEFQIVSFPGTRARFIKMNLLKSLNDDSSGIAEIWVVPTIFSKLDITKSEEFLSHPFGYVVDKNSFKQILNNLSLKGKVKLSWKGNYTDAWQTADATLFTAKFDAIAASYKITIPANGTHIEKIKLDSLEIPGNFRVLQIQKN